MAFKKIKTVIFNENNEAETTITSTLKKVNKSAFTREVAKEYLKELRLENEENNVFISVYSGGHLFVNRKENQ